MSTKNKTWVLEYKRTNTCVVCGKEFKAKRSDVKCCSKGCKRQLNLNKKEAHGELKKICPVCGKGFKTYKSRKKTCSDECSYKLKNDIRYQLEREKRLLVEKENCENNKPTEITIIDVYLDDKCYKVNYKCNKCGSIYTKKTNTNFCCKNCENKQKEINKKAKEYKIKLDKKIKTQEKSVQTKMKICKKCGSIFYSEYQDKEYCSKTCQRSASRKRREERYGRRSKVHERFSLDKIIDDDISLKKLYEKNNGYCWICGEKCNYNDFEVMNGTTICGDMYPSIDHVIPRAKGGYHSWGNVKLAHRRCNYIKNDKIITEELNK